MEKDELLKYFMNQTNGRFDKIDQKLEDLISFKLKLMGGAAVISALISILVVIMFGR